MRQKGEAAPEYGKLIADLRCVDCRVHRLLVYGFIGCLRLRGWVTLDRCRDARLQGGGALRAARCRRADVESFGGVRLARCRAARADWCGTVEVELCRAVDVTRCGAVTGERCRVVNAAGCGSVDVARAVINLVEEEQQP